MSRVSAVAERELAVLEQMVLEQFFDQPRWPARVSYELAARGLPLKRSIIKQRCQTLVERGLLVNVGTPLCAEWMRADTRTATCRAEWFARVNREAATQEGIHALRSRLVRYEIALRLLLMRFSDSENRCTLCGNNTEHVGCPFDVLSDSDDDRHGGQAY